MQTATSSERRASERRHLVDRRAPVQRRSGTDRRIAERRGLHLRVTRNRRSGKDRRHDERRHEDDRRTLSRRQGRRRRTTPSPFSAAQIETIQQRFSTPGVHLPCPACGGTFTLGPAPQGADPARQVLCASCGKNAVVRNCAAVRIIVVAQKETVRQAVRQVLSTAGHEVLEAADATVALWAYDQNPADVVFVDAMAPGRTEAGEFIRLLRREHPDARVVVMAGRPSHGMADPRSVTRAEGATRTIRFPCSQNDLLAALDAARP